MSNIKPDGLRRQAAEDEFFRLAALEIESEQNEEFLEAQSLPDPSPEVLQRMQAHLQQTMRKTQKRKHCRTIFLNLKRLSACAAIVCCLLISGTYFSVDAARNSINNFVLEFFDDHSTINTEVSESQEGISLPVNWQGPFFINWVPARFTNVRAKDSQTSWKLIYGNDVNNENMSIYVWNSLYAPYVNTENAKLVTQEDIQGAPASIFFDSKEDQCTLIWTKNDYIIQIGGTISPIEAKKIAENFVI